MIKSAIKIMKIAGKGRYSIDLYCGRV